LICYNRSSNLIYYTIKKIQKKFAVSLEKTIMFFYAFLLCKITLKKVIEYLNPYFYICNRLVTYKII